MGGWGAEQARRTIRVLLVEDDPADACLVRVLLEEDADAVYDLTGASCLAEAMARAGDGSFDIVLTDLGLPDGTGLAAVDALVAVFPNTPVVVLTGLDDREMGRQAMQRGCQDYLVKGCADSGSLPRIIAHAIERSRVARSLRDSEERYRRLVELCPDGILVVGEGRVLFANPAALRLFAAASAESLLGHAPESLLGPKVWQSLPRGSEWPAALPAGGVVEESVRRLDGSWFEAEVMVSRTLHAGRAAAQVMIHDVSVRKQAEHDDLLAAAVFETTDEAILVTDADNRIVAVNPSFERVTGFRAEEVLGQSPRCLSSGRHDRAFYHKMWGELLRGGHWRGEIWNRRKSGEVYVQRVTLSLVRDASGAIVNHVAVFSDITDAKQEAERIRYRASYDALTDLPNRALLHDRLHLALATAARERGRVGFLFLDLDGFKQVNDRWGHLAGDRLLIEVARRLKACVRESDTVARLGGDEFVVVLPDMVAAADAQLVAAKVLSALAAPFRHSAGVAEIGASVGIALYPEHGDTSRDLLAAADSAMYAAKNAGRGCYVVAQKERALVAV